jgi:hypothetical protein
MKKPMKNVAKKLQLGKESLVQLSDREVTRAIGAISASVCTRCPAVCRTL